MQHKNKQSIVLGARKLAEHTKVRFILVGMSNTLIDVALFNMLLTVFSTDIIAANIISTTAAMLFSYAMNKQAVFRSKKPHTPRQVILFLLVTLTGIWLIQTIIMVHVLDFLQSEFITQGHPLLVWFLQNVAKGTGIIAGAVWNYFGYSRIVFAQKPKKGER